MFAVLAVVTVKEIIQLVVVGQGQTLDVLLILGREIILPLYLLVYYAGIGVDSVLIFFVHLLLNIVAKCITISP